MASTASMSLDLAFWPAWIPRIALYARGLMLRVVVVTGLLIAVAGAALGIYDHQRIQRTINHDRTRISTSSRASSRLHQEEDKQNSRDILFGVVAGAGVLIALGAVGRTRFRRAV